MKRRFIGLLLAGLLLIGGATAVLAQSGGATGAAGAVAGAAAGAVGLLGDVLDDLVGDGTITQAQADAIERAVEDRKSELRQQAKALREQMRTFLEDGTLSADELAQLPADHPLRNLDRFLEDGQLTKDELRQLGALGRGHGRGFGFGFGPGHPHHGPGGVPAPEASGAAEDSGSGS